jgi:hypothetical protein
VTLTWKGSDGRWDAAAVSFRNETRWIEVNGTYVIEQLGGSTFDTDYAEAGRRFSVTYHGESVTVLGVRRSLGGARVLAGSHYENLCAACRKSARDIVVMQAEEEHGMRWFDLPLFHERNRRQLSIRHLWWREADGNRCPPSPEFIARLPQLLAAAKLELENDKREIAADTAKAIKFLRQARRPLCEQCLRLTPPCRVRCLRSVMQPLTLRGTP